jgi:SpoVK/Ycf46/Vps4 family AAA+-type ATPase
MVWCFDLRVPVLPPTQQDREAIFSYYLRRYGAGSVPGGEVIEPQALAARTPLFTPADIKAVVELTKTKRRLQVPGAPRKPGGAAQLVRARGLQTAG